MPPEGGPRPGRPLRRFAPPPPSSGGGAYGEVRFEALGSTCHLMGAGLERDRLEEGAAWVAEMHQRFSRFLPDSELSRFNAEAGRQVEVSAELEALLRAAVEAWWSSGGLVNACVLEAML